MIFRLTAVALLLIGCGSASYYEPATLEENVAAEFDTPVRASPAGPNWREGGAALIPAPAESWPVLMGEDQRVACAYEMDVSRAHVSRAIESAKALGSIQTLRCLSKKAAVLKTLRGFLDYPDFYAQAGADPRSTCLMAQSVVHQARQCR